MRFIENTVASTVLSLKKGARIGIAVSGGSDSVALFHILADLQKKCDFFLVALTVDHGLREESRSDAMFVESLCRSRGVPCEIYFAQKNEVAKIAATRKRGVEDGARFLRYSFFRRKAEDLSLDVIFTAHTKDDLLESLLMQFLSGREITGIKARNKIFMRPFLSVEKSSILAYLRGKSLTFREDSTNGENRFLRNKIRNLVVPKLDETLPTWKNALITSAEKIRYDRDATRVLMKKCPVAFPMQGVALIHRGRFEGLPLAAKRQVFLRVFSRLNADFRVSSAALNSICGNTPRIHFKNLKIEKKNKIIYVFLQKAVEIFFDSVYIYSVGIFKNPRFSFEVRDEYFPHAIEIPERFFPFSVRQVRKTDKFQFAEGKEKSIFKILAEWKIPADLRPQVLILEHGERPFGILGKMFFAKNRIIKADGRTKWLKIAKSPEENRNS